MGGGQQTPVNSICQVVTLLQRIQMSDVKPQHYNQIDPIVKYLKNVQLILLKISKCQSDDIQAEVQGELANLVSFHKQVSADVNIYATKYIQKYKMAQPAKFWQKARDVIQSAMEKAKKEEQYNIQLKKMEKQLADKTKAEAELNKKIEALETQMKSNQPLNKQQEEALTKILESTIRGEVRLFKQPNNSQIYRYLKVSSYQQIDQYLKQYNLNEQILRPLLAQGIKFQQLQQRMLKLIASNSAKQKDVSVADRCSRHWQKIEQLYLYYKKNELNKEKQQIIQEAIKSTCKGIPYEPKNNQRYEHILAYEKISRIIAPVVQIHQSQKKLYERLRAMVEIESGFVQNTNKSTIERCIQIANQMQKMINSKGNQLNRSIDDQTKLSIKSLQELFARIDIWKQLQSKKQEDSLSKTTTVVRQQLQKTYELQSLNCRNLLLNEIENAGKLSWVEFTQRFDIKDKQAMVQNVNNISNKSFAEVVIRNVILSIQKSVQLVSNTVCEALSINRNQFIMIEQLTQNSLKQQKQIMNNNEYCQVLENEISQLKVSLQNLQISRKRCARQCENQKNIRKAQKEKCGELQTKLAAAQSTIQTTMMKSNEQKAKWKAEEAKYKQNIKEKQAEIERFSTVNVKLADYNKKTEEQNKSLRAKVSQLHQQVSQLQKKLTQRNNEIQAKQSQMSDYKAAYTRLKDEVNSCLRKAEVTLFKNQIIGTLAQLSNKIEEYKFEYDSELYLFRKFRNFVEQNNVRPHATLQNKILQGQRADTLSDLYSIIEQIIAYRVKAANLLKKHNQDIQKPKQTILGSIQKEFEMSSSSDQVEQFNQHIISLVNKIQDIKSQENLRQAIQRQRRDLQERFNEERLALSRDLQKEKQELTNTRKESKQAIQKERQQLAKIKNQILTSRQQLKNVASLVIINRNQFEKQITVKQKQLRQLAEKKIKIMEQLKTADEELEKKNKEKQQETETLNLLKKQNSQMQRQRHRQVADSNRELSSLNEIRREYADIKNKLDKANSDYKQKQRQIMQLKLSLRQHGRKQQKQKEKSEEIVRKINTEAKEAEKKLQIIREEYQQAQDALTRIENDIMKRKQEGEKITMLNPSQRGFPFPQMISPADTDFIISQVLKLNPHCTIKQARLLFKYPLMGSIATQAYRYIGERPNFIVVVKLKSGRVIAMYSQISLEHKRQSNHGISFIASVTNRKVFYFREDCEVEHSVAICFGSRLIFGNGELLLYMGYPSYMQVDINPHMYSFETVGQTAEVFVGGEVKLKHEVDEYEIIQVEFETAS